MRISHEERRVEHVEVVDDIICNQCGRSCVERYTGNVYGLNEVKVEGGCGARLGDMTSYRFSLCERCLTRLFDGFEHPPLVHQVGVPATWERVRKEYAKHLEE